MENEKSACREDDRAAGKGGVDAGFAVEHAAHVDAATTSDAAEVVEFRRGVGLSDFPFLCELPDVGFGFFVDLEGGEVLAARLFVDVNVGGCAVTPVLCESAEVLDPFFSSSFVGGLESQCEGHRKAGYNSPASE